MVITMRQGCPKSQIGGVLAALKKVGLAARLVEAGGRTVLGVVEEISREQADALAGGLQSLPGVEEIHDFTSSWKLAGLGFQPRPTEISLGRGKIGGGNFLVIAGPCAVESRQGYLEAARAVAAAGAGALRGGAYKPRTSPYSFRGLGEEGLDILAEARRETGLPVVTEVLRPEEVETVAARADVLQIGARNMQNFALLEAVGDLDKPVLLKRGLMATIKELLLSAEYILARGNGQVMLCERGIRTFESETRNTLDIAAVAVLKQYSHLPVVVDPSHAAGKRELVPSLALAALAAGADGLMVEVHPDPDQALSDGRQSLTPAAFKEMMAGLQSVAKAVGKTITGA